MSQLPSEPRFSSCLRKQKDVHHGLAELRANMQMNIYPAEELLEELTATAASDGRLTR